PPSFSVSHCPPAPRDPHSFPTRRSSDLARLMGDERGKPQQLVGLVGERLRPLPLAAALVDAQLQVHEIAGLLIDHGIAGGHAFQDRKSTRLNSSHVKISYAVFCLKKKTK